MNFSAQFVSLFVSLDMIGWKHPLFILPSGVGSPRYFSSKVDVEIPRITLISDWVAVGQVVLKRIEHLLGLRS
jgi:hypothetical protein